MHIAFTEEDWQRIARDYAAWWAGELPRPLVTLQTYLPTSGDPAHLTKWGLDTPVETILDNAERLLESTRWHGDAYPKWWVNCGAGVMAAYLGSPLTFATDTTWFWPLPGAQDLASLHLVDEPANPWRRRVLAFTQAAVERWGSQVLVGTTDLGGNLDILASLRGTEKLLYDLLDAPTEVERLSRELTRVWLRCFDELYPLTSAAGRGCACWAPPWSPGPGYMLQCDFSYMISPRHFQRFVMPDLEACCEHLDYAFFHMDGKGQIPHLDALLSIPRLRGIQWQPGDGQPMAEHWLPLMQRMRAAGKLVQVWVTCQGAREIKKALGGQGFLFDICESLTPEQAEAFIQEMMPEVKSSGS